MRNALFFTVIASFFGMLAACTHDFDTFEGVAEAGLVTDASSAGDAKDGALSDGGAEACAPAPACTNNARNCTSDCNQNQQQCEQGCNGGNRNNCRNACRDAGATCINGCVSACVTCAGCPATAACQNATN